MRNEKSGEIVGVSTALLDVSASWQAENALQQSEARLRATFEAAPIGVIFAEAPSGRLTFSNPAVERIFLHPTRYSASVDAYDEWESYHADGRRVDAHDHPLAQTLQAGVPAHGEDHFVCGDGVRRWIAVSSALIRDAAGEITGAVVVSADVDDARRAEAVLARVTEPFFTTKEPGKGTGLGLAMAQGLAEQSLGSLQIESSLSTNTRITLWFPATAHGAASRPPALAGESTFHTAAPRRLLVVDDDAVVRQTLVEYLELSGYEVARAASGPEALQLLSSGLTIDLVVSDLSMPAMDGISLMREIQLQRPGVPAILLTGFANKAAEIAVGGTLNGAFTLLHKPIDGQVLSERVDAMLSKS